MFFLYFYSRQVGKEYFFVSLVLLLCFFRANCSVCDCALWSGASYVRKKCICSSFLILLLILRCALWLQKYGNKMTVVLQPLQLQCIHAQLSWLCDLATKCHMSTKMIQTTNQKSPTALLTYKPKAVAILPSMPIYPQRLFCRELFVIGQSK